MLLLIKKGRVGMERFEETIEFLKVLEEEIKKLKDIIQQLLEENQQLKKENDTLKMSLNK